MPYIFAAPTLAEALDEPCSGRHCAEHADARLAQSRARLRALLAELRSQRPPYDGAVGDARKRRDAPPKCPSCGIEAVHGIAGSEDAWGCDACGIEWGDLS